MSDHATKRRWRKRLNPVNSGHCEIRTITEGLVINPSIARKPHMTAELTDLLECRAIHELHTVREQKLVSISMFTYYPNLICLKACGDSIKFGLPNIKVWEVCSEQRIMQCYVKVCILSIWNKKWICKPLILCDFVGVKRGFEFFTPTLVYIVCWYSAKKGMRGKSLRDCPLKIKLAQS